MTLCPYCNQEGEVQPRYENDPHGNPMCEACSTYEEIQPRLCYNCDEYGLIQRQSGVWICCDCGIIVSEEESITEHRVASSADYMEDNDE